MWSRNGQAEKAPSSSNLPVTRVGSSTRPALAPFAFQWEASGRTGEVLRALPTRMRDHQQQSWNNSPGWTGRDREYDQGSRSSSSWTGQDDKWAWDQKDRGWRHEQQHAGNSKESSSSWKGQEDKWTWDQKDHDDWHREQQHAGNSNEWKKSWGYSGQNKTESRNNSW